MGFEKFIHKKEERKMAPGAREKRTRNESPRPFTRLWNSGVLLGNLSLTAFFIEFRITKQIVVTFVATTLKALQSVPKTNGGVTGRKLYAGNIDFSFWNRFAHISPYQNKKVRQPKSAHRKTQTPIAATQNQINGIMVIRHATCWNLHFCQIQK